MISQQQQQQLVSESRDGSGAGDHDQPYRFGRKPSANVPYPFNTRQYARLLVLRSRVQAGHFGADDV
ncbi:MAG TPA: hypothetical protein VFG86_17785 [Chloroflexota bacterium]|nr:hypothetical protein [Chloroflexota bacterium]